MSLEQLLLLAVFVLVPLLSFLRRLIGEPRAGRIPGDVEPPRPAPVRSAGPVTTPVVRGPREARLDRPAAPVTPGPPPRRPRRRPRLGALSPEAARRGVVLMSVLGRCRGLDDP